MTVISLDQIVKSLLLKRGYSLHYYMQFLVYAASGLREISFDDVQVIRYSVLPLNDNHAIVLPDDYVDYCRVSVRIGQYLQPLVSDNSLDLVPNYDAAGDIQPYNRGIVSDTTGNSFYYTGYLSPGWWTVNWNEFGENLGRQFGGIGSQCDTFKENRARNEIKINEDLGVTEAVLEYIGNGLSADNATHIDAYCQSAIEAYAMWQFKENNRTYQQGEVQLAKQQYMQERQILRARKSDLTIDKLKRIVQSNTRAIKY